MFTVSKRFRRFFPRTLKRLVLSLGQLTIFSDVQSLITYLDVVRTMEKGHEPAVEHVDLAIRQLKGQKIRIRTRGKDAEVVYYTFLRQFHVPPRNLVPLTAKTVLDLGANIGCTMAHFACLYPQAAIWGVELNAQNATLAQHNTNAWAERCHVIQGAVWHVDGEVQYEYVDDRQDAYSATDVHPEQTAQTTCYAPAFSLNTICSEYLGDREIDYIKMDIEGAERDVLRKNTEWAARVRCIKVELHQYEIADCIADLRRLGFEAKPDTNHHRAVLGVRT